MDFLSFVPRDSSSSIAYQSLTHPVRNGSFINYDSLSTSLQQSASFHSRVVRLNRTTITVVCRKGWSPATHSLQKPQSWGMEPEKGERETDPNKKNRERSPMINSSLNPCSTESFCIFSNPFSQRFLLSISLSCTTFYVSPPKQKF